MGAPKLDLLLVIDSSPSMAAHVERLATTLPGLLTALEELPIGLPSLHVGVITADLADDGRLRPASGLVGNYISDVPTGDGTRARNYTGELIDVFRGLIAVGTAGSETARPFEAARRALDDHPANAGFRRPGAYLAVVYVTANDDASPAPIADYVAALQDLVRDPGELLVGTIAGDPVGSMCGEAPAPRLHQLAKIRAGHASICGEDVSAAFDVDALLRDTLGLPCWENPLLDLDPATPALDPDCTGWLTGPRFVEDLTACPTGPATSPCYRIEEAAACPHTPGHTLIIDGARALSDEPMHATVECAVAWSGEQDPS